MTKKTSPVRKIVKKGKQKLKAVSKSVKGKQPKVQSEARQKTTRPRADLKTTKVDAKRQLKIQKALFEIADAASAVKDSQEIKRCRRLVGCTLQPSPNYHRRDNPATTGSRLQYAFV